MLYGTYNSCFNASRNVNIYSTDYTKQTIFTGETKSQSISTSDSESDRQELKYILNRSARKLPYELRRTVKYVDKMNQILEDLDQLPSTTLAEMPSHKFYITIRDTLRDLLLTWHSSHHLTEDESYLLRNAVHFFHRLVLNIDDVTKLSSWLLDSSFVDSLEESLNDIDRLLAFDKEGYNFKQLSRLFGMFKTYYERLPSHLQDEHRLDGLFQATMNCLMSSSYDRTFRKLKSDAKSMSTEQKFFLIKCPSFLTNYYNSQLSPTLEQILQTMVPRYASILDKHLQSVKQWTSPMIHAVHHLLLTVTHAKRFYTPYASGQPLQWLTDNIIRILRESSITEKVTRKATTPEKLLIDSILRTLVTFVREPELLVYIKQLKITSLFRSMMSWPTESIAIHAYVMLAYLLEEDDIKASEKDSGRFLSTIFDLLRKKTRLLAESKHNRETIQRHISLLVEAVQVLVQHDQIKSEILKQNTLTLLIDSCQHFNDRSKRLLLESLGSITFDDEAARLLRENTSFIHSVEDIQKNTNDRGIQKAADKIIWNLIKEPEREQKQIVREESIEKDKKKSGEDPKKKDYQYDIMISYCHADKELVYRIHEYLVDKGFKIWIDRDNIYGPATQAMADAVENAEFVIICMSDSYKRSVYCQAEAEYAFRCKRHLLPIIVRQGYRADGWLGLIMGSRIYIDYGRLEFKKACELLFKEITLQKENQLNATGAEKEGQPRVLTEKSERLVSEVSEKHEKVSLPSEYLNRNTTNSAYRSIPIKQWTRSDVLDFLFDQNLHSMMPLCEVMTGQGLLQFFQMCQSKPSRFCSQLNDELTARFAGLYLSMGIFTQFLTEIDAWVNSSSSAQTTEKGALPSNSAITLSRKTSSTSVTLDPTGKSLIQISSTLTPQQALASNLPTVQTSYNVEITEKPVEPLMPTVPSTSDHIVHVQ